MVLVVRDAQRIAQHLHVAQNDCRKLPAHLRPRDDVVRDGLEHVLRKHAAAGRRTWLPACEGRAGAVTHFSGCALTITGPSRLSNSQKMMPSNMSNARGLAPGYASQPTEPAFPQGAMDERRERIEQLRLRKAQLESEAHHESAAESECVARGEPHLPQRRGLSSVRAFPPVAGRGCDSATTGPTTKT